LLGGLVERRYIKDADYQKYLLVDLVSEESNLLCGRMEYSERYKFQIPIYANGLMFVFELWEGEKIFVELP
jgi:hypothetical protein